MKILLPIFFSFLMLLTNLGSINTIENLIYIDRNCIVNFIYDDAPSFSSIESSQYDVNDTELFLPLPLSVNMSYRSAIMLRCSVRRFISSKPVGDDELSTILWAAYGFREDGSRTVHPFEGSYSTVIYVFRQEAVYTYNPKNHSLLLFKEGDLRRTVNWQHTAPIQLGLVWDLSKNNDANYSSIEMGEIGQNIYFMASALGLGTVTAGLTGFNKIDLPENHVGRIVMPLGYPQKESIFRYKPNLISFLPRVQDSDLDLKTVIEERRMKDSFEGEISRKDIGQLLWASYGFSYFLDITNTSTNEVERHRTVPSASCVYPLVQFAVTKEGIFRYVPHIFHLNPYSNNSFYSSNWKFPVISFILPIRLGDYREEIAQASSQHNISTSPLLIVSTLQFSNSADIQWYWYYEAGASAYNVMLESTLLNLHAGMIKPTDIPSINSVLRIPNTYLPLLIIPVGE